MHCNSVHSITWDIKINLFLPLRWPNFIIIWYFPQLAIYIFHDLRFQHHILDAFFVSLKEHNFQYCFKHQVRTIEEHFSLFIFQVAKGNKYVFKKPIPFNGIQLLSVLYFIDILLKITPLSVILIFLTMIISAFIEATSMMILSHNS